jgi:hypothetical protein
MRSMLISRRKRWAHEKAAAVRLGDGYSNSHGDHQNHQKVISKMHLNR